MAFIGLAALGGAAKSLSKGLKDERDEALKNAGIKIKLLTEMGLPKARARKAKMKSKNDLYDKLDDHFSAPQIAKILQEDKGQAVLDHIDKQRNTYADYKVKPNDIVTLMDDYADLNLTKDQILENVMGKVGRGMTVTDAMKDVAGKGSSLTSFFGGDLSGIGKRQFDSIASATGVSMEELQALSSDNITYDDPLVKGTITLSDPATQARAKAALRENMSGAFTSNSFYNALMNDTGAYAGISRKQLDSGEIVYTPQADNRDVMARDIVLDVIDSFQAEDQNKGRNKFTFTDRKIVQDRINERLKSAGLYVGIDTSATAAGSSATGTGTGTAAATGATQNLPTPPTSTNPYLGSSAAQIPAQVIRDASGLSGPQQSVMVAQARAAIINSLSNPNTGTMSVADATKEADDIVADIMTKI
tara:strand:- start:5369 stop:6622 length:1254 start_codon:yes stop_codon:yes gene_type:complete